MSKSAPTSRIVEFIPSCKESILYHIIRVLLKHWSFNNKKYSINKVDAKSRLVLLTIQSDVAPAVGSLPVLFLCVNTDRM